MVAGLTRLRPSSKEQSGSGVLRAREVRRGYVVERLRAATGLEVAAQPRGIARSDGRYSQRITY